MIERSGLLFIVVLSCLNCMGNNNQAIEDLKSGKRSDANVMWWGFNQTDSTAILQKAIDSGAKKVVIPKTEKPWISGPLYLRSNQEILLEPGAILQARDEKFVPIHNRLLNLNGVENVSISGYGATIKMNRHRYILPPFYRSEFRHIISVKGGKNIKILGVSLTDSGGDGIMLAAGGNGHESPANILIKDVKCLRNFRQGLSVISAVNLRVENCLFAETGGTKPGSGVDLEPESDKDCLENVVFSNCRIENNQGSGFQIYAFKLTRMAKPFSVKLENCIIDGSWEAGFEVGAITRNGPDGTVVLNNCEVKNTFGPGILIREKASNRLKINFVNCKLVDTAQGQKHPWAGSSWAPKETFWREKNGNADFNASIIITTGRPLIGQKVGDVEFVRCSIAQKSSHPTVILHTNNKYRVEKIKGTIQLVGKNKPDIKADAGCYNIDLKFIDAKGNTIAEFKRDHPPEYAPVKAGIKIKNRKNGEYSVLERGKCSYDVFLKPEVEKERYRLSFRCKCAPDFIGRMIMKAGNISYCLKPVGSEWQELEFDNVTPQKSGKNKGQVIVSISATHNNTNRVIFADWKLEAIKN